MQIRAAEAADVAEILAVLQANAADTSLFQQPERQVRARLGDFLVAVDDTDGLAGCAALHVASATAEILAVAVRPSAQGHGVGRELVEGAVRRARALAPGASVWLATAKPMYFARFGFAAFSKWRLPVGVLLGKLVLIRHQPVGRWLPALFGRHTFMRLG